MINLLLLVLLGLATHVTDGDAATTESAAVETQTAAGNTGTDDVTAETPKQTSEGGGGEDPLGEDDSDIMLRPKGVLAGALAQCDTEVENSCNSTNLERCVLIQERDARCVCLHGFARGPDGLTCVAVKAFTVSILTRNPFTPGLYDTSSLRYRTVEYNAREAIFQAMKGSNLRSIGIDVDIVGFKRSTEEADGKVIIEAQILISRAYAPALSMVKDDLKTGIADILRSGAPDSGFFLGSTGLYVNSSELNETSVIDPDPCDNPLLNYCSVDAGVCTRTSRSFVCACMDGFDDLSPNKLEAPGEICQANCNCVNGGECLVGDDGAKFCRCPSWYLGYRCETDGKIVLIVVCCILGALLVLAIAVGFCYIYKLNYRRPRRYADGSVVEEIPRSESDARSYKVRRPPMDPWKYNTYSPNSYYPQYVSYWANDARAITPVHYANSNYPAMSIPRPQTMGVTNTESVINAPRSV